MSGTDEANEDQFDWTGTDEEEERTAVASRGTKRKGDSITPSTLKKQRLAKNRESAKESRRRKKEYVSVLEDKISALEAEALQLKLSLNMGKEAMEREEKEKRELTAEMQTLLDSNATEDHFRSVMQSFRDRYADYGSDRKKQLEYHLNQMQRLILPNQTTKMLISSLHQEEDADKLEAQEEEALARFEGLDGLGIWNMLCKEVDLTMTQQLQFLVRRENIKKIWKDLQQSFTIIGDARKAFLGKNSKMEKEMDELQECLTPEQQAKFVLWIQNNAAFMQMLNKLLQHTVTEIDFKPKL